jgi:alpha-L-fucosidase
LFFVVVLLLQVTTGYSQKQLSQDERMAWWRYARFGMFIHWGPVTLKGTEIGLSRGGEVPIAEYDTLYKHFNPDSFNADEWVNVAKASGMKYIVLTTKHVDGFCLWNAGQSVSVFVVGPCHTERSKIVFACVRLA